MGHCTNFDKQPIYSGFLTRFRHFMHNYAIKSSTFTKLGDVSLKCRSFSKFSAPKMGHLAQLFPKFPNDPILGAFGAKNGSLNGQNYSPLQGSSPDLSLEIYSTKSEENTKLETKKVIEACLMAEMNQNDSYIYEKSLLESFHKDFYVQLKSPFPSPSRILKSVGVGHPSLTQDKNGKNFLEFEHSKLANCVRIFDFV